MGDFIDDAISFSTFGLVDTDFFGGSDPSVQGYAQSPGQSWLQGALQPLLRRGIERGVEGKTLYPIPPTPRPNYSIGSYSTPNAPFSSPADFASGYGTILNRMIEPFGESLGSARGGWSGAGQQVLGSAMGEIAPQIMNQYVSSVLPYNMMQTQANKDVWEAGINKEILGYTAGEMPRWNQIVQSYAAPWNLAGLYSGTYGSPIVDPGSEGFANTAATLGLMGLFL